MSTSTLSPKELQALQKHLRHGDYSDVARKLKGEYTRQFVAMVANGSRQHTRVLRALIAKAKANKRALDKQKERISKL